MPWTDASASDVISRALKSRKYKSGSDEISLDGTVLRYLIYGNEVVSYDLRSKLLKVQLPVYIGDKASVSTERKKKHFVQGLVLLGYSLKPADNYTASFLERFIKRG